MQKPRKLDVEVFCGRVVGVWFGCLLLPFEEHETSTERALELKRLTRELDEHIEDGSLTAMDLLDMRLHGQAYGYNKDGTLHEPSCSSTVSPEIEERQV